jgi:flagellar basal-body rod protein FlgF
MDRLLYVAMSGASQTMLAQAANNNNLANANTTGFRADLSAFRAMPVFGPGAPSRVYAMAERPGTDFTYGSLLATGRDLDVAVKGEGWIAVQGPDGREGYTRAGDLRISTAGLLENGAGHLVLGNSGPIAIPPAEKIEIGADGTVSIQPIGQSAGSLTVVDRIKLVNPPLQDLMKDGDGLMRTKDDSVLPPDAAVGLSAGTLEASNVNPVDAMVNMISLARQFEMQVKMMRASQENDASAAQILRMG